MKLVIATLDTRHFTFEGAGTDAPGAHKALSASVTEYLASLGADLTHEVVEYYRERLDDEGGGSITYREYVAGKGYRDSEEILSCNATPDLKHCDKCGAQEKEPDSLNRVCFDCYSM